MDSNIDLLNGALLGAGGNSAVQRFRGSTTGTATTTTAVIRTGITVRNLSGNIVCKAVGVHQRWTHRLTSTIECKADVSAIDRRTYARLSANLTPSVSYRARLLSRTAGGSLVIQQVSSLANFSSYSLRLQSITPCIAIAYGV